MYQVLYQFYYNISDIFIFPSLREGVSNALLEAMSCKITPIITKLPGISEFILNVKMPTKEIKIKRL